MLYTGASIFGFTTEFVKHLWSNHIHSYVQNANVRMFSLKISS